MVCKKLTSSLVVVLLALFASVNAYALPTTFVQEGILLDGEGKLSILRAAMLVAPVDLGEVRSPQRKLRPLREVAIDLDRVAAARDRQGSLRQKRVLAH